MDCTRPFEHTSSPGNKCWGESKALDCTDTPLGHGDTAIRSSRPTIRFAVWICIALGIHATLCVGYLLLIPRAHRVVELDRTLMRHSKPLDVLIVGDSHAQSGVEPAILGRSLNVAVAGEHYLKSRYRVPWLIDRHPARIRTVVTAFDHVSFSGWKADMWEPERVWGRYVNWFELGVIREQRWSYMARWSKANLAPYVGELETVEQRIMQTRGFRQKGAEQQASRLRRRTGVEAATAHFSKGLPTDPTLVQAQADLVADLRARNIQVVLVSFPVSRGYFETAESMGATHPRDSEALQSLLADPGVHYVDLSELFLDHPDRFYDGDHLGGEGRRAFTWALRRELVNLALLAPVRAP